MSVKTILEEYLLISSQLFEKNFLNIGLGSVSLKLETNKMIINKKNRHPKESDFALKVNILDKSLGWEEASEEIVIHSKIFEKYSNTKAIAVIFPKNAMTFASKRHSTLNPIDYRGKSVLESVPILDIPKKEEWEENKEFIISQHLKNKDVLIVNGFGVIIKSREIRDLIKKAVIIENSSYIILNSNK